MFDGPGVLYRKIGNDLGQEGRPSVLDSNLGSPELEARNSVVTLGC